MRLSSSAAVLLTGTFLVGVAAAGPASAGVITVDGSLSDWGVTVADNNASNFGSLKGDIGVVGSFVEDQDDGAGDGGYVGPYYGGQNYDAEFMAVAVQGSTVYVGIASGVRPDNGLERYGPGDMRIETWTAPASEGGTLVDVFAVEFGGGVGGGAGGPVTVGDPGTTYALDGSGYTTGATDHATGQTAGSIWKDPVWTDSRNTQIKSGTYVGDLSGYNFTRDSVTNQHSIIELSFDLSQLGDPKYLSIYWWPSCGNDIAEVLDIDPSDVPEPQAILIFVVGLVGLVFLRRRQARARGVVLPS